MSVFKLLCPVIFLLVLIGCMSKQSEPPSMNYIIIRMVARSPTSPVLGYGNDQARVVGTEYAERIFDIRDISAYEMKPNQIDAVRKFVTNDSGRDAAKTPPYFVFEFGTVRGPVVAYSIERDSLLKVIPLMPSNIREYLQLMYDSTERK